MNVLVTDAGYKHTLGIVRELGKENIDVFALANNINDVSLQSRFIKKYILIDDLQILQIKEFCKQNSIDLILPISSKSVKFFSNHRDEFISSQLMSLPTKENLEIANTKRLTYDFCKTLNINVPNTFYPSSIEDISNIGKEITFPCVIKGLYEVGGGQVTYVYNPKDLKVIYKKFCELHNVANTDSLPMIQEYIEGNGVGFFGLYQNGKYMKSYQHERIRENPPEGGASVCAKTIFNKKLFKLGKTILDQLDWNGVAMVEFKKTKEGEFFLMEINAKFWGSHDLGIACGANFPKSIIQLGTQKDVDDIYKKNLKYQWPLNGDISSSLNSPKRLLRVLVDLINPKVKNNLHIISDPKPTWKLLQRSFFSYIDKIRS